MAQTYGDCWRTVRLYVSAAPLFLVREWVNVAWKQLVARRNWGFLRGETEIRLSAARSVAGLTMTQGSITVTGVGVFLTTDAGRQFRIGRGPTYTIQTVPDVNTITLDRAWADDTAGGQSATINDAYVTMPADFGSFRVIADPYNRRQIAWWITEDRLQLIDPDRTFTDSSPRALAAQGFSTYLPTLGRVRYEVWPRPTAVRVYPVLYNKQAANLDDTSIFTGVLADGAQVVIAGALMQAAEWPGTPDLPNPYFNRGIAADKRMEFEDGIQRLSLKDDAQYGEDYWAKTERAPITDDLAYDDHALRASDATLAAFA